MKRMESPAAAALAALAACLLLVSCSLFDPRGSEPPEENNDRWQPPYSPQAVLSNIMWNLEDRNIFNYSNSLDTSFVFAADPADVMEWGGTYDLSDWGYEEEVLNIQQLFYEAEADTSLPPDSVVEVVLITVPEYPDEAVPSGSTDVYREYYIFFAGSSFCSESLSARGIARIFMLEDDYGLWRAYRWEDNRPEIPDSSHTFALVKAEHRP